MNLHRGLLPALALVLFSSAVASTPTADDPRQQRFEERLASAHALARDGRDADAARAFARVIDDPRFAELTPSEQRDALSAAGWAAIQQDQASQALALYRRAIARDGSDPDDWYRAAMLELESGDADAGAVAMTELVERWPDVVRNVPEHHILRLVQGATAASPERVRLLRALYDANWRTRLGGASEAWYELAVESVDRGDLDTARAAIRRIATPEPLVRLRSDKRFDAAMAATSWSANAERAAQLHIDALTQESALAPQDLEVRSYLGSALLTAGRHEETIALAARTLEEIAAAPQETFEHFDDRVWLMNNRAIALRRLGRTEEALAELQRAAQLTEEGHRNVSQALNLGSFYCSLQRPDDALRAIGELGRASGYGRLVEAAVRHCAALQKHDARSARKALAFLRDHRSDGELIYLEALLRDDDLDSAAQVVRELLASPQERGAMLMWMQDYLRPAPLPGDVAARAARDTLLARADVREALASVGRIARYELYLDGSMD